MITVKLGLREKVMDHWWQGQSNVVKSVHFWAAENMWKCVGSARDMGKGSYRGVQSPQWKKKSGALGYNVQIRWRNWLADGAFSVGWWNLPIARDSLATLKKIYCVLQNHNTHISHWLISITHKCLSWTKTWPICRPHSIDSLVKLPPATFAHLDVEARALIKFTL